MNITLNGQGRNTNAGDIRSLLDEVGLLPTQVAVELNGTVLFRHEYDQVLVRDSDRIEIVRVVAGG